MNKLTRSSTAFAQRVLMGRARLWLIVEGRDHDRSFYDRLLETHPQLGPMDYEIRLAEEINVSGVVAGGKRHVTAILASLALHDVLVQEASSGKRSVLFVLDRDYDDLTGQLAVSRHLLYTRTTDVEAEIVINGDPVRAAATAFSLPRSVVDSLLPARGFDLAQNLANHWRDWIELGVSAACCAIGGARYSQVSKIHAGIFGALDSAALQKAQQQTVPTAGPDLTRHQEAMLQIDDLYAAGLGALLVKGKWLPTYIHHLVTSGLPASTPVSSVPHATITKIYLETVDFGDSWATYYRSAVDVVLAA